MSEMRCVDRWLMSASFWIPRSVCSSLTWEILFQSPWMDTVSTGNFLNCSSSNRQMGLEVSSCPIELWTPHTLHYLQKWLQCLAARESAQGIAYRKKISALWPRHPCFLHLTLFWLYCYLHLCVVLYMYMYVFSEPAEESHQGRDP